MGTAHAKRSACPSDETLAQFVAGSLGGAEVVEAHVATCAACHGVLAAYGGAFARSGSERSGEATNLREGRFEQASLPCGTAVGRYVVMRWLGEGSSGVVYAAYDPELDRKVALKWMRRSDDAEGSDWRQQAQSKEARAMAKLANPHVVAVYDSGLFDGEVFLAMELVDGPTLRTWLAEKPRDARSILAVFLEAGAGLWAAHRAGLVHRDFKPDNVLLGADGRARVTDFGLARATRNTGEGAPLAAASAAGATTTPAGTPAYMAPEQLAGRADARSDQFSFCVALYEALYGEHPFDGRVCLPSRRRACPEGARVSRRVRLALERGLRQDPAERHDSMGALLADLGRAHHARWKLAAGLLGAATLAVMVAASALHGATRAAGSPCTGAAKDLASTWNDTQRATLSGAFLSASLPFAADAWRSTERALDAHARDWVRVRTEACEATGVRHEQSDAVLDQRMRCLDRNLVEMRITVDVLSRGGSNVVTNGARAAEGLASPSQCTALRAASLTSDTSPALEDSVERARALRLTSQLTDAEQVAREAVEAARAQRRERLRGEGLVVLGNIALDRSDGAQAEGLLFDAYEAADRVGATTTKAASALQLARALGVYQRKFVDAERWLRLAANAVDEVGDDDRLRANLAVARSGVHTQEEKYEDAIRDAREAVHIIEERFPDEPMLLAPATCQLACALLPAGKESEAAEQFEHTLTLDTAAFGSHDPRVARDLVNLAVVDYNIGRYEEAMPLLAQAAAIVEQNAPQPALTLFVSRVSAAVLIELGRNEEARSEVGRALAITTQGAGDQKVAVAALQFYLGAIDRAEKHASDAMRDVQAGLAIIPSDSSEASSGYARLGRLYFDMGQPALSVAPLERAFSLLAESHPVDRAGVGLTLARALWQAGKDRERARGLVADSRAAFREHPLREKELDVAEDIRWWRENAPGVYGD